MESNEFSQALRDSFANYQKLKMLDILSDRGLQYLQGRNSNRLLEEERTLNIMARKRQLGLPNTTSEYERLTNDGPSFVDRLMPSMQKRALEAIPGPSFLPRKPETIAHFLSDLLPSRQTQQVFSFAKNLGGNRYGRAVSALGRAFSL
jgi:hypothetical protein